MDVDAFSPVYRCTVEKPGLASHTCWLYQQAPTGVSFSLGYFSFTPGVLPYTLRASFAVRARSCVRVDKQKRSDSRAAGV